MNPTLSPAVTLNLEVSLLEPCPLNPADRSKSELESLKHSILENGVLSSLVVRSHPEEPGRFEVICGERRLLALRSLIESGLIEPDFTVPCTLRELSDFEVVLVASEENLRREDMTPFETLKAYCSALRLGATLERVALSFRVSERAIERRVAIVERGSPELLSAIESSRVDLKVAAVIIAAPEPLRAMLLERALAGVGANALRELAQGAGIPVSTARFALERYQGSLVEDALFGLMPTVFADPEGFFRLQREWCLEEVERLKAQGFGSSQYATGANPLPGTLGLANATEDDATGYLVFMRAESGEVVFVPVVEALQNPAATKGSKAQHQRDGVEAQRSRIGAAPTPPTSSSPAPALPVVTPLPAACEERAFVARSTALKDAMRTRGSLELALRLTLLALESGPALLPLALRPHGELRGSKHTPPTVNHDPAGLWDSLSELSFDQLEARLLDTLALHLGDHSRMIGVGRKVLSHLAAELGLSNQKFFTLDSDYLGHMTKDALWELAQSLPIAVGVKKSMTKTEMIGRITAQADALSRVWMPPHFAFPVPATPARAATAEVTPRVIKNETPHAPAPLPQAPLPQVPLPAAPRPGRLPPPPPAVTAHNQDFAQDADWSANGTEETHQDTAQSTRIDNSSAGWPMIQASSHR